MFPLQLKLSAIVPSIAKQTSSIIFLHGLGDTGLSWAQILPDVVPSHTKIICPNAPAQHVSLYNAAIPSWFDLRPLDQPKDVEGIKSASEAINELIKAEVDSGIPSSRIIIGGFSQGGALALFTGLTSNFKLGGILALSTWLPVDKIIDWGKIQKPNTLQCHGDEDDMISLDRAEKTAKTLKQHLPNFEFKAYTGLGHNLNSLQEVQDIKNFVSRVLSSTANDKSS